MGDAVLHACILAVRKALHDAGRTPSLLHTVRGRGYRFVAPVKEQARMELATAIDFYRAMEMMFWLPQAEGALAQVGGIRLPVGGA